MKSLRSESPAVKIAVFASLARTQASPIERAQRERRLLERARLRTRPPARPARGVS